MLSVKEASELVGRTKSALNQKIKSGKLSATRDSNGYWCIDPAELERVYGKLTTKPQEELSSTTQESTVSNNQQLVEQLQYQLEQQARDIEEWKRRYDSAEKERREAQEKVTALLEDKRERPKGLLNRLFGH